MAEEGAFDVARKSIYWMIAGFVITVLLLAFLFIVAGFKARLISVPEALQAEFVSLRFANIPECFAYEDVSGRVHPGIIDASKFTEEQMKKCYSVPEEKGYREFNFELELQQAQKKVMSNEYYQVPNKNLEKRLAVLVRNNDRWEKDTLIVRTQTALPLKPRT